jgi:hypothetical protein
MLRRAGGLCRAASSRAAPQPPSRVPPLRAHRLPSLRAHARDRGELPPPVPPAHALWSRGGEATVSAALAAPFAGALAARARRHAAADAAASARPPVPAAAAPTAAVTPATHSPAGDVGDDAVGGAVVVEPSPLPLPPLRPRALAARRGRGRAAAREAADAYGREPVDATQLSRRARISKLLGRT